MIKKLSQEEIVLNRIAEVGYVDNFWAIENRILRLGAVIYDLRKNQQAGDLICIFGRDIENLHRKYKKNYYYINSKFAKEPANVTVKWFVKKLSDLSSK